LLSIKHKGDHQKIILHTLKTQNNYLCISSDLKVWQ
jgi:hypothetical protein